MEVYLFLDNDNNVLGWSKNPTIYTKDPISVGDEFIKNSHKYSYINGELIMDKPTIYEDIDKEHKNIHIDSYRNDILNKFDKVKTEYMLQSMGKLTSYPYTITDTRWQELLNWKQQWLDIKENIDYNLDLESQYPQTPIEIEYFK